MAKTVSPTPAAEQPAVSLSADEILAMTASSHHDAEPDLQPGAVAVSSTEPKATSQKAKKIGSGKKKKKSAEPEGGADVKEPVKKKKAKKKTNAPSSTPGTVPASEESDKAKSKSLEKSKKRSQEQAAMMVIRQDEEETAERPAEADNKKSSKKKKAVAPGAVADSGDENQPNKKSTRKMKTDSIKSEGAPSSEKKKKKTKKKKGTHKRSKSTTDATPETELYRNSQLKRHTTIGAMPMEGLDASANATPNTSMENSRDEELGIPMDATVEATIVTEDDFRREVQEHIEANTIQAEVIAADDSLLPKDNTLQSNAGNQRSKKRRYLIIFAVLLLFILGALIGIIVAVLQNNKDQTTESSNEAVAPPTDAPATTLSPNDPSLTFPPMTKPPKPGPGNGGPPPGGLPPPGDIPESGFVYVLSMEMKNFCGHDNHAAPKCGGHAAAIHNEEEMAIVMELIKSDTSGSNGYWIGGEQTKDTRNDEGPEDTMIWTWTDGTPWFDNDGAYWKEGEPSNSIGKTNNGNLKGEHSVFLTNEGKYNDKNGCSGILAPKRPGILLLPFNYRDVNKFPECDPSLFVAELPQPIPISPMALSIEEP